MNVFILNAGRSGSTTFIRACQHISNHTAAHESRSAIVGDAHFAYPENHIEADNRLSWFLGRLDKAYGNDAMYVHLKRNDADTARSWARRYRRGMIRAYRDTIFMGLPDDSDPMAVALDYCSTISSNIELFLKDKSKQMDFSLENAQADFRRFWDEIGAEGDLARALAEWDVSYNASRRNKPVLKKVAAKLRRIVRKFPAYLQDA